MDNRILVFLATTAALILAMIVGAAVASGELMMPVLAMVALATVALVASPEVGAFLVVATYASGLTAPGLPGQFGIYYVSAAAVMGCAFLAIVFRKATIFALVSPAHWLLVAFCAIVLYTGLRRGLGFQFLGSNMWGGFYYIQILASAALVFTLPSINMASRWWPRALVAMGLLAPLPLIADLLVLHGFGFSAVRMFLQTGATITTSLSEQESGIGVGRLESGGLAAQAMLIALLAVVPTSKFFQIRSLWTVAVLALIFILSLLSGFRLMTMELVGILFVTALFQKTFTPSRVAIGIVLSLIILMVIYQVVDSLPLSMQRAISWLPGVDVSTVSAQDAEDTVTWRLDLWREAIHYIPEYFWLGKGFSYDANLFLAARSGYDSYDALNWALVTGGYHNGYLSLLLCLGIFGFLTGLPLLVLVVWRHLKITRSLWNDHRLLRAHQAMLALQSCSLAIYLTVYGDVQSIFPGFFFTWAVMEALRDTDQKLHGAASHSTSSLTSNESLYSHLNN